MRARSHSKLGRQRKDYSEAFERLKKGQVTSPQLLKFVGSGVIPVTPTNVCLEAKRSRTPLYRNHRELLRQILDFKVAKAAPPKLSARTIESLNEKLKEMGTAQSLMATENLRLTLRIAELERLLGRARRRRKASIRA